MQWSRAITVYGAHAEGEIGRVVTGGILPIPGNSMREKLVWLNQEGDNIRKFCLFEPRGAAQMTVNLLTPACSPNADAGFIPMQGDGSHAMSGSNAMCVTTVLLESGMIPMQEPQTTVTLDTAAGLIKATATCEKGRAKSIELDFFPSFVEELDVKLEVPGLGKIKVHLAFGGVYYVLVDALQLDLEICPANARKMVELGSKIKLAAQQNLKVQHPQIAEFNTIDFCMFTATENEQEKIYRNATIMPPGRIDRSPCGTGTAARLAVMHAQGRIGLDDVVTMRSTIGSRFQAKISGKTLVGDRAAITTRISGRAWIYGIHQLGVDPSDPFQNGYTLSDTWGEGIEHIIPAL